MLPERSYMHAHRWHAAVPICLLSTFWFPLLRIRYRAKGQRDKCMAYRCGAGGTGRSRGVHEGRRMRGRAGARVAASEGLPH